MNQKTCKRLRKIALGMGVTSTTGVVVKMVRGREVIEAIDFYKELKKRHAALPHNKRAKQ